MDNPHLVTPEEAKEKICPQSMGGSSVFQNNITTRVVASGNECFGPECMAWRWERLSTESAMRDMNSAIEPQKRTSFLSNHSTTHGYCGMVRDD